MKATIKVDKENGIVEFLFDDKCSDEMIKTITPLMEKYVENAKEVDTLRLSKFYEAELKRREIELECVKLEQRRAGTIFIPIENNSMPPMPPTKTRN